MNKNDKNNEKTVITVAIYIRVSTEEQAKRGYSLDSQLSRLKEYAREKGYKVYKVFVDEGKSARSHLNQRKKLLELLEDVKQKKLDRIIFWRLDRWFRNIKDYYKVQEILDDNNVDWECSDEEYNTTTSNGRLYLNIKLSIAQNESDQTGDRIRFNFENMIKSGKAIIGTYNCPKGYKVEGEPKNKRVVKNEDESPFIEDLFNEFTTTMSLTHTVHFLADKYPKYRFVNKTIKLILTNPLYYGCYKGVENYCEPYITKEKYDEIQKLLAEKLQKHKHGKVRDYIFTGMLTCPDCGRRLSANGQVRKRPNGEEYTRIVYRCNKHFADNHCPNNKVITEALVEKWLLDNYKFLLEEYVYQIEDVTEASKLNDDLAKIKRFEDKLKRLNDLYIDGLIDREKYDKDRSTFLEEIERLKKTKGEIPKVDLNKIKKIINDKEAINVYNSLTKNNKRLFWSSFIDRLVFIGNKDYDFKIYLK